MPCQSETFVDCTTNPETDFMPQEWDLIRHTHPAVQIYPSFCVRKKGIKSQQFHWDTVLEVSWCLKNSRMKKPGISWWNAEFLSWFFECPYSEKGNFPSCTKYHFRTQGLSGLFWGDIMATLIVFITEDCLWNTNCCAQLYCLNKEFAHNKGTYILIFFMLDKIPLKREATECRF